jgi:hypothetical protein
VEVLVTQVIIAGIAPYQPIPFHLLAIQPTNALSSLSKIDASNTMFMASLDVDGDDDGFFDESGTDDEDDDDFEDDEDEEFDDEEDDDYPFDGEDDDDFDEDED